MCRCGPYLNPNDTKNNCSSFLSVWLQRKRSCHLFNLPLNSNIYQVPSSPFSLCVSLNPNLLNLYISGHLIWVLLAFFSKSLILRLVYYVKFHC
ncbi:hypothetical protein HRI_004666000 [Hibiscus trionum]|uniref:Uncharacterized protein n=1 Tax=Hibiscus trionum TaxID=183268 RepID=A0A9W7MM17_HIBTR|nr:hypothetical protein HRI_004666000 [Hibiscus trionum]